MPDIDVPTTPIEEAPNGSPSGCGKASDTVTQPDTSKVVLTTQTTAPLVEMKVWSMGLVGWLARGSLREHLIVCIFQHKNDIMSGFRWLVANFACSRVVTLLADQAPLLVFFRKCAIY